MFIVIIGYQIHILQPLKMTKQVYKEKKLVYGVVPPKKNKPYNIGI